MKGHTFALAAALHMVVLSTPMQVLAQATPARAGDKGAPSAAAGQDLLQKAQQLFDDQQYEECIQTLGSVLVRPNNTKQQRVDAMRLLAVSYITLNRKDEAENTIRGLLGLDPEYRLPASESPRFRDFFLAVRAKWEGEGRPGVIKDTEPPKPVNMKHSSPAQVEPNANIELTARVEDPDNRVTEVKLYFRAGSKGKFEEVVASLQDGRAKATIPGAFVKPPLVEYYFLGADKGGLPLVARGDANAPLRIAVPEASRGWVLPVAIGGGILGAAAIVGGLALAGVFKSSSPPPGGTTPGGSNRGTVSISIGE